MNFPIARRRRQIALCLLLAALLPGLLPRSANAQASDSHCNWRDASQAVEFPQSALKNGVIGGEARVHGEVMADGRIAVAFIETSDPVFNEPALAGVRGIKCTLPPGSPFQWPLTFKIDEPASAATGTLERSLGDVKGTERRIVMLLPQGIDPSNDHDGLNDLSRRLDSALGARICEALQRRGIGVIAILDQRPVGILEKLEAYAGTLRARHVLVITVEKVAVDDEDQLRYRVQYGDNDLIFKADRLEAVVPSGTMTRTFKIKGSKSGAANISAESIADDFLKGLDSDGRLKGLAVTP